MNKYHVFYLKNNAQHVYNVVAKSEQEAYNKFRYASNYRFEVVNIVNHTAETRRNVGIVAIVAVLIALLAVCITIATSKLFTESEPIEYVQYTVQQGDTLWGIASKSDMWNKIDASVIIDDMKDQSECTSTIYPGQIVYIPIYES